MQRFLIKRTHALLSTNRCISKQDVFNVMNLGIITRAAVWVVMAEALPDSYVTLNIKKNREYILY